MNHRIDERIVVTGLGVVCPAGVGLEAFWLSILRGTSSIREKTFFPNAGSRGRAAGIAQFEPATQFSWSDIPKAEGQDRLFRIAQTAIDEALAHAGLAGAAGAGDRADMGLYISSAIGPMATMEAIVRERLRGDLRDPGIWRTFSFGRIASLLASRCDLGGPYAVLPTGCAGGCDALGYGLSAIRSGAVDRAVVGAFEAPVTPLVEAAFARINATSSRDCPPKGASCPFDTKRPASGCTSLPDRRSVWLWRWCRPAR